MRQESCISNTILRTERSHSIFLPVVAGVSFLGHLKAKLRKKAIKRRAFRASLVLLNLVLLIIVGIVVAFHPTRSSGIAQSLQSATMGSSSTSTGPVDVLASANIAITAARMVNLPETAAIINQADSENIETSLASANNTVVNKPQSVASNFISNKDIHTYVAQAGDTVSSVADKFSVSSDSIRWSNSLRGDTVSAGQKLLIPPMNGIVYTIKSGDTANSLAATYHSDEAKIVAYNDAEIDGLHIGEQILIPNGSITPAPVFAYASASSGFAWGSGAIYGFNGYDWGECTYYVATQIAVPANWGNAATWAAGARAAGWHVSSTPTVGAIAQTPYAAGGLGHVAIVDGISADGSQVFIRDMNGLAGFDRVGTGWESTATYPNYITR